MIYSLYVVAKGIDEEGTVVVWTVLRPRPRSPIVLPPGLQSCIVTSINGAVTWRARQQT